MKYLVKKDSVIKTLDSENEYRRYLSAGWTSYEEKPVVEEKINISKPKEKNNVRNKSR